MKTPKNIHKTKVTTAQAFMKGMAPHMKFVRPRNVRGSNG